MSYNGGSLFLSGMRNSVIDNSTFFSNSIDTLINTSGRYGGAIYADFNSGQILTISNSSLSK